MIKRLIKSRLAIAFATFAITAAMIGGATYATTSSPTDVYYACASLTGNIRASSIRLNSEPVRCSSSTDHVVQWDAAGQQIQPVAGRLISLETGMTFTREAGVSSLPDKYTWPAVDTSECKELIPVLTVEARALHPRPEWINGVNLGEVFVKTQGYFEGEDMPHQEMWYHPVFPNASRRLGITPDGEVTEGRFGYAHSVDYQIASVVAEQTALEFSLATSGYSQEDFSMTITKAALYCTPY